MDQDSLPTSAASFAAQAFTELRAEVSLLRRATERLTDERGAVPDYGPSIEALAKRLEEVCVWARKVSEQPAMRLTPRSFADEIGKAAGAVRHAEQQALDDATAAMRAAAAHVEQSLARARSAADQQRELRRNRLAFGVAGIVLWSMLPGAVARSLPVSWAVPERIAARMLGTDQWQAGATMMSSADPERWSKIVAANSYKDARPAPVAP